MKEGQSHFPVDVDEAARFCKGVTMVVDDVGNLVVSFTYLYSEHVFE